MISPTHLIVGPRNHGVTAYALELADHARAAEVVYEEEFTSEPLPPGPIHVTFTDHLFGPTPATAVNALLERLGTRPFSVSLHDIPQPEEGSDRFHARSEAYLRLSRAAHVTVVNSEHEANFFAGTGVTPTVIPLPIPEVNSPYQPVPNTVGVIGYLYPGKGHEDLINAVEGTEYSLVFMGQVSAGHERWARELLDDAARRGVSVELTGWLSDEELHRRMGTVEVAVCPHRHFSASGSLMTWLGAGRRVIASDSEYTREIAHLAPHMVVPAAPGELREKIESLPRTVEPSLRDRGWEYVAKRWNETWDATWPCVSVIIPHYNAPESLLKVIEALRAQDYPGSTEIIVADDGSEEIPQIPGVRTVSQPDRGFRAAAARNLGAEAASGEVLAFLDADTVPSPSYLSSAIAHVARDPRAVVVGSRRTGARQEEPEWLRDAWEATDNLRSADYASWRYIISAALTCGREFFRSVEGFDETMVGYGGEDWEFGFRAWNAGATFVHEPRAVAFHEEEDWAGRSDDTRRQALEKNAESVALAPRVTHPLARPHGVRFYHADVAVYLPTKRFGQWGEPGVVEAVIASWLAAGDVAVVVSEKPELFAFDTRVRVRGGRERISVHLSLPAVPRGGDLAALISQAEYYHRVRLGSVAAVHTARAEALGTPPQEFSPESLLELVEGPIRLERFFAGW